MNLKDLQEKRDKAIADARAENDKITPQTTEADAKEIEKRFDGFMADADKYDAQLQRELRLAKAEARSEEPIPSIAGRDDPDADGDAGDEASKPLREQRSYLDAYRDLLRYGFLDLPPEQRSLLQRGYIAPEGKEKRAQTITTTGGGYLIPQGFQAELDKRLLAFGGMFEFSRILRTDSGNPLPWPTTDDTSNEGELLAINTAAAEQDVTFGTEQLDAFMFSSKIIRVPFQLLQDSAFNLDVEFPVMLAERLARSVNRYATVGTGSSQPQGVVGAASAGVTLASSTDVTFDELIDMEHSLDPSYRQGARWMMHDTTLKVLRKKKDNNLNYIWSPGTRDGIPPQIWNYPYTINQHMPILGSGNKPLLFGLGQKFIIRQVRDTTIMRLTERYAEYLQVGFLGFARFDSELIDAGGGPIRYAICPSP
jgi:HK97 family phage major capsid protein